MIRAAILALATVCAVSDVAALDATPDRTETRQPQWRYSCAVVRKMVDAHGEGGAIAIARGHGVPESIIERAKRECLKK